MTGNPIAAWESEGKSATTRERMKEGATSLTYCVRDAYGRTSSGQLQSQEEQ
ncbi:hypothetical protein PHLCEN_2v5817 [Hermanssonia centrifuga]|uniref:Uncharacterized protein n=1 Tax=Hermanssonia centrifuga TaxID=98765 RepID=A0A2R6P1B3_9APHY|nr:hypothetical protein PHLCEN_2v5817 [Hermanssonia centrifuga]